MKQPILTEDNLTEDLKEILSDDNNISSDGLDFGCLDTDKLLEQLVIYIVYRDHKVLQHGIKVGKELFTTEDALRDRETSVCQYATGDNRITAKETVKAMIDSLKEAVNGKS